MVRQCSVPNCTSVNHKSDGKISIFASPKDPVKREEWSKILNFTLQNNSFVCEKHFKPEDIHFFDIVSDGSKILYKHALEKPRLKRGALPIGNNIPSKKNKMMDCSVNISENINEAKQNDSIENNKISDCSINDTFSENILNFVESNTNTTHINEAEQNEVEQLFDAIYNHKVNIQLPNEEWGFLKKSSPRKIFFCEISETLTPTCGKNLVPALKKQIALNEQLEVSIFFGNKIIKNCGIKNPKNKEEIETLLKMVDKMNTCAGGPKVSIFPNIYPQCAFKDHLNHWRHNNCSLILDKGSSCRSCLSLYNTFMRHLNRKQKCTTTTSKSRRKRVILSPNTRNKVKILIQRTRGRTKLLSRRQHQIEKRKVEIDKLHKQMDEIEQRTVEKQIEKLNLPSPQVNLIMECITLGSKKSLKNHRYSDDWLLLCLLLYIRSSSTYNFLKENKILPLPAKSTICKYLRMTNTGCGFDEQFFKLFKKELEALPEICRHGILVFDEIQVRTSIAVNVKTMKFDGLRDYGDGNALKNTTENQANHALVFMFSSLMANFHQPVAIFAVKGATPSRILASLVLKAIIEIEKANGKVHGLVCDGATTNRSMWTQFGISGKINNLSYCFSHPLHDNRVIYAISDAPHLIKCIRNVLFSKKVFKISGKTVEWKFFEKLFSEDIKNPDDLRVCPALTANHINPTNFLKMRVSYATQIFSRSVACGLKLYMDRDESFKDCEPTIFFTLRMNDLFDALNRKFPKEGIQLDSRDFKILKDNINWIDEWERELDKKDISIDNFLTHQTADGLRVTLHSVIALSKYLLTKCNFKYVLTAKMNQDCLEKFFGIIRQAGCQNDHPTLPTFLQLYHLISMYKLLKPPKFGNCTENVFDGNMNVQNQSPRISFEEFKKIFPPEAKSFDSIHVDQLKSKLNNLIIHSEWECDEIIDHDYNMVEVKYCILYYVCGFICKKMRAMKRISSCAKCQKAFNTDASRPIIEKPEAQLVNIKTRGKLIHPNSHIFQFLKNIEFYFSQNIENSDVYNATINDLIDNKVKFEFPCDIHKQDVISFCVHYYITLRMRQYAKQENSKKNKTSQILKKQSRLLQ